jgi:invasion protein IalB
MFDSTNFVGYISAILLIGVSFAAVFLGAKREGAHLTSGPVVAAPVTPIAVDTTFIGNHTFGYWTLVCDMVHPRVAPGAPPAEPRRICRTNAQKRVQANEQILLAAGFNVLFVGPQKEPGILFRLPPSASSGDHINFAIDANTMFAVPMGRCTDSECVVQGMLPAEALEQMKTGKTITVIYTAAINAQNREIRVEQPLHGFPESFDALAKAVGL